MIAVNFRERVRHTLKGFFDIELANGLMLKDCSYHERDGKRWVLLPSRAQIHPEGRHATDPATGKKLYISVVEIKDRGRRERFQAEAMAAVDRLLGTGTHAASAAPNSRHQEHEWRAP
jgi:hypothetical protein